VRRGKGTARKGATTDISFGWVGRRDWKPFLFPFLNDANDILWTGSGRRREGGHTQIDVVIETISGKDDNVAREHRNGS
jgi:hypothetical protein